VTAILSQLFRSFLPLHNPLGFDASDFIEFEVAALLVLLIVAHSRIAQPARRLAGRTGWCTLLLAILPAVLRLSLLAASPVPLAAGADDFAHLLVGDTLRHFRLANPPHPLYQFFETVFVLQQPTHSSIFPLGQGLFLTLGSVFGHPWLGVVLSVAALCALCYWVLRAWTTPGWALVGGLLAVIEYGPLRYWMNTYWGGAVSAVAGCLVFGAMPRLRASGRLRDAALLGLGIGLEVLARPFESVLLLITVVLFFLPGLRRPDAWSRSVVPAGVAILALLPAGGLTLLQNQRVTGSWTTLPYVLSRYQYGVPASFTLQANPVPHRELTLSQKADYEAQASVHGAAADSPLRYIQRLAGRLRFYPFFFLAPLYLALPFFVVRLRAWKYLWVALALLVFALGSNFYPYFYPHYIAAAACLFVLVSVAGLEHLATVRIRSYAAGAEAALLLVVLCVGHFLFWYGFHLYAGTNASIAVRQYETWNFVNHGDPDNRIAIARQLAQAPGKQLVLVRYAPLHRFGEWIQNVADIDRAPVVWALDRGSLEDKKLLDYYRDRTVWLLEPDARPIRLGPYQPTPLPPAKPVPPKEQNGIQLLPVE
jgi:hypothetical protein